LESLTTGDHVVIMSNMKAEPLLQERRVLASRYDFTSPARLLADFWDDADRWRS